MNNKFSEVMARCSDSELIEIITKKREEYESEALKAAEVELKKRNLSTEQIQEARESVEEKDQELKQRAEEPLGEGWMALNFFLPGLITYVFAREFKADGYERKYNEAKQWMIYGFGFYLGLIVLLIVCASIFFK